MLSEGFSLKRIVVVESHLFINASLIFNEFTRLLLMAIVVQTNGRDLVLVNLLCIGFAVIRHHLTI